MYFQVTSRNLNDLNLKSYVYAKYKNGRYYNAQIVDCKMQTFYHVDFDDGSFSDNLHPEDIEVGVKHDITCFDVNVDVVSCTVLLRVFSLFC